MDVALQCSTTVGPVDKIVDSDGRIAGNNSGLYLVRQAIRQWPGLKIIGPEKRQCDGFQIARVKDLKPLETLVVSMDMMDTHWVDYRMRYSPRVQTRVVNFFWANVSDPDYKVGVDRAALALAVAHYPTFANSPKTQRDLRRVIDSNSSSRAAHRARLGSALLGIDLDRIRGGREQHDVPVVLFPGIYLMERKRPGLFMEVCDKVAARTPLRARVRVSPRHAQHRAVEEFQSRSYVDIGPQTSQEEYYDSLRSVDVALATSSDESYGLAYVEAMASGAVGLLPDIDWARVLVPSDYPFLYRDAGEAAAMLMLILKDLPASRRLVERSGVTREHWAEHHDGSKFFPALERFALEHYPRLMEEK